MATAQITPRPISTSGRRVALHMHCLEGGGGERVMVNLAIALADKGHLVDLVLADASGPYRSLVPENVRIVDLKVHHALQGIPGLVKYLQTEKPIALLTAMERSNIAGILARSLSGVETLLVIAVHITPSVHFKSSRKLKEQFVPAIARLLYQRSDKVLTVSSGAADDVAQYFNVPRSRVEVIYNPVISDELFTLAAAPCSHRWMAPNQPPVVLGAGRLVAQKDFSLLLHSFSIARRAQNMRLIIIGEGDQMSSLKAIAKDLGIESDVDFPGFVSNPYSFMSRCAAFVLSSKWEGLPTVLIEALACGAPVVSTDCPSGPREILKGGVLGKLVEPGNPDKLAAAIVEIVNGARRPVDPSAYQDFQTENVTSRYEELLGLTTVMA